MAITIGKTATVVLNRFCNLVLKPEPVATGGGGGGTFLPGDFTFNNIFVEATTNTITFTKSGRLCITGFSQLGDIAAQCYINNVDKGFFLFQNSALLNPNSNFNSGDGYFIFSGLYGVFDINVNDTMYFSSFDYGGSPFGDQATVSFYLTTFNGTLISQFTIDKLGI